MRSLFTATAYLAFTGAPSKSAPRRPTPKAASGSNRILRGLLAAGGVVLCFLLVAGESKAASVFLPAPAYPNSTLAIDLVGKPRAGKVARVVVSGSNAPFEIGYPGSGDYLAYQLDAFAQNAKVLPECPRTFREELQNHINLGLSRIAQGLNEGYYGPFAIPLQFRTSRKVRDIVVCAYSRMVDDDAAVSALRFRLRRP